MRLVSEPERLPRLLARSLGEPCTCAIYATSDPSDDLVGGLVGSGLYVRVGDRAFILTAKHVAVEGRTRGHLCRARNGQAERVSGVQELHPSLDLALLEVGPITQLEESKTAWRIDRVATKLGDDDNSFFLYGFPGERSRTSALLQGSISEALAITLTRATYDSSTTWPEQHHFAIEYPEDVLGEQFTSIQLPGEAGGLSGSPIWHIDDPLNPSACRLIGLAVAWDQQNHSLVAVRPEAIIEFWRATGLEPR